MFSPNVFRVINVEASISGYIEVRVVAIIAWSWTFLIFSDMRRMRIKLISKHSQY